MQYHAYKESGDDRVIVLTACSATVVTMPKRSGKVFVTGASSLFLRSETPTTAAGWVDGVGWWNARFAWLNQFRRLRVRYEKRADIHEAFLALGCILICWRFLHG
jgi:transposase